MSSVQTIRGVLIDLSGVLYVGSQVVPGSTDALEHLRQAGLKIRYLTNTTRSTRANLLSKLRGMGFPIDKDEVFSAPIAARRIVEQRGLRPFLVIHPDLEGEFADIDQRDPNAVVVGDAGARFTYGVLNQAFRVLMQGALLISMGSNRYFREPDGLSLDMGPFVTALEFAAGVEAEVVGKPAGAFFQTALEVMGCSADRAVMIGDDLPNDVGGAQAVGVCGVLVRTGKYRPEDEHDRTVHPDHIADDFPAAVQWVLDHAKAS